MTDHTKYEGITNGELRQYINGHGDQHDHVFVSINGTRFAILDMRCVYPVFENNGRGYFELVASSQAEYRGRP